MAVDNERPARATVPAAVEYRRRVDEVVAVDQTAEQALARIRSTGDSQ